MGRVDTNITTTPSKTKSRSDNRRAKYRQCRHHNPLKTTKMERESDEQAYKTVQTRRYRRKESGQSATGAGRLHRLLGQILVNAAKFSTFVGRVFLSNNDSKTLNWINIYGQNDLFIQCRTNRPQGTKIRKTRDLQNVGDGCNGTYSNGMECSIVIESKKAVLSVSWWAIASSVTILDLYPTPLMDGCVGSLGDITTLFIIYANKSFCKGKLPKKVAINPLFHLITATMIHTNAILA